MNRLLLATPIDPQMMKNILNESREIILKVTLISVDYAPIEVFNGEEQDLSKKANKTVFGKKQNQAVMFDVVGVIVDIIPSDLLKSGKRLSSIKQEEIKKVFVIANEVMFITNDDRKLISLNGNINILPNELINKIYANIDNLKSSDLNEIEDLLEVSKDETAIKAFKKLGSYFTARKYEVNNNVFNLIEHQEKAEEVARKVILKKMVFWEIKD